MARKRKIDCAAVPEPPAGSFTNCLEVGGQVFISGMTAGDGAGGIVGDASPFGQSATCLGRIRALIEAAGGTMADVVKLTVFLTDIADRSEFSRARREVFSGIMPCSTLVAIGSLAQPGLVVEVEALALLGAGGAGS